MSVENDRPEFPLDVELDGAPLADTLHGPVERGSSDSHTDRFPYRVHVGDRVEVVDHERHDEPGQMFGAHGREELDVIEIGRASGRERV